MSEKKKIKPWYVLEYRINNTLKCEFILGASGEWELLNVLGHWLAKQVLFAWQLILVISYHVAVPNPSKVVRESPDTSDNAETKNSNYKSMLDYPQHNMRYGYH